MSAVDTTRKRLFLSEYFNVLKASTIGAVAHKLVDALNNAIPRLERRTGGIFGRMTRTELTNEKEKGANLKRAQDENGKSKRHEDPQTSADLDIAARSVRHGSPSAVPSSKSRISSRSSDPKLSKVSSSKQVDENSHAMDSEQTVGNTGTKPTREKGSRERKASLIEVLDSQETTPEREDVQTADQHTLTRQIRRGNRNSSAIPPVMQLEPTTRPKRKGTDVSYASMYTIDDEEEVKPFTRRSERLQQKGNFRFD